MLSQYLPLTTLETLCKELSKGESVLFACFLYTQLINIRHVFFNLPEWLPLLNTSGLLKMNFILSKIVYCKDKLQIDWPYVHQLLHDTGIGR